MSFRDDVMEMRIDTIDSNNNTNDNANIKDNVLEENGRKNQTDFQHANIQCAEKSI